ncbi:hypothetical protein DFH06DRAFT_1464475 [Mycena polygramma]|nr:hypothetical protein DFH06DRAFT_1464475 [Mycena polygramma]
MSPARHHHPKNMALLNRAQSSPGNDSQSGSKVSARAAVETKHATPMDTVVTLVYESIPSTPAKNLRASQVTFPPQSTSSESSTGSSPLSKTRISERELAFVITAALFGIGVLLLAAGITHLVCRRRRERLTTSGRDADTAEQGLDIPRDFDDSTWGMTMDDKRHRLQEHAEHPPLPTPSTWTPRIPPPEAFPADTDVQTPSSDLTAILEQFEQRLHQEEKDIALALDIAFGHDTRHCAPFFAGSEDDVTTMLSLQAGLESVGKRACGIRNRARQGSDASNSSQSTTVTIEGFSSHSSSTSSLTSLESMMSDIDESAEEAEEEVVYEVKRAQTRSMEIQRGKLIAWQPTGSGVQLMVTGPSTTTLASLSSASVDLDDFPLPPARLQPS